MEMSCRVYRVLVRLYPRDIRDKYGEEMVGCFADICRDELGESGPKGLAAAWLSALPDLVFTALKERSIMLESSFYRYIAGLALATVFILLVPLVARWPWTTTDFVFAGVLIFGTGLMYLLIARSGGGVVYRAAVGVALAAVFLLIWGNAAVGITDSDADLMYIGVPVVGVIGAAIARLRARGMARTLFAMAFAQVLISVIALTGGIVPAYNSAFEVLGITGFYAALFVGAGLLFKYIADRQVATGTGS